MQGERTPIPMYRNESDHWGQLGRLGEARASPPCLGQPRPAALGHSPWDRCGIVCEPLPES